MKIALIGLPQTGKRTLFTLLTDRLVPESRRAGDVVEGISQVWDLRVDELSRIFNPKKTTYAENHFVLCPDADTSGNSYEWLAAARRCQLVCLVLRAFESDSVYHPTGSVDPERDREVLEAELLLSDMDTVETRLERLAKESKSGLRPEQKVEQRTLFSCAQCLEEGQPLSSLDLADIDYRSIRSLDLVTFLPLLAVYNVSEDDLGRKLPAGAVAVSCQIESEIAAFETEEERGEYLRELGVSTTGLDRVSNAAYDALGLMSFYTVGEDECRAWTIHKDSSAPVAGGQIHSDIERGFIRAEIIKYDDFLSAGLESEVRNRGQLQTRGRDYILQDGDIVHFLFRV
ncbi:MAG: DUF933 domain-containing protein [Candidatus Latescibacterota bacterium]|nr:DUF933 domain-containing protein [Candidatus Latescibacterota bacterium]